MSLDDDRNRQIDFAYQKEPLVNCFACMKLDSLEESKAETAQKAKDKELTFAVVLKEKKVFGEMFAHPEREHEDATCDAFSPCRMLNKDYHGHGYGYKAAQAVIDYY